jgi:CHAD domain-containing protein
MAYSLKQDEAFKDGIERIVLEQVDKALENLKPTARNKDEAIHDARVCVKKIRAVLRMIRDSLGEKSFEEEDVNYRDVARLLSKVRDSTAMLEIIDKLTDHFSDQLSRGAFENVGTELRRSKSAQRKGVKLAMYEAARSLRKARGRIKGWPKLAANESLAQGLKRTYKRGKKNFKIATDVQSVETFHEWRKYVKHLLYQTRVLTPLWERVMKSLTVEIDALGELLSEHHDLAILRERVTELLGDSENRVEIETLVALIDQRSNELEIAARHLGKRIYAETPRAFVARSATYWQALRSEAKNDVISIG